MRRSWILGGGLSALALLASLSFYARSRSTAGTPFAPRKAETAAPSTPSAAGPAKAVDVSRPGAAAAPRATPLRGLFQAQGKALSDLLAVLDAKGGAAALQRIRDAVLRPSTSLDDRLHQAFLARLIAHVAAADPSATAAALALSREILQSPVADPWARLQAAAGLGGLSSLDVLPLERPGRLLVYLFLVRPPDATQEGPFHVSLREAARNEPGIATSLPSILGGEKDPQVREALVRSIGEIAAAGAGEALRGAALADPEGEVRRSSLDALERAAAPELGDVARRMARSDEEPENQAAALDLLGRTSAADPATARFLGDCLANQEPRDALPALARSAFAALEAAPSLQDGLSRLLLQKAADPELAEAFAKEAVDRGLPHFLPLLRTMEHSLPAGAPSREVLARAATQLEDAPRYAALAQRIKGVEKETRTLMEESARDGTPDVRRTEIQSRIGALLAELWDAERRLGR